VEGASLTRARVGRVCDVKGRSGGRKRDAALSLVLSAAVGVRNLTFLVGFEEEHLGDALIGVDLGGQGRGVGELQGHVALPLRKNCQVRKVHFKSDGMISLVYWLLFFTSSDLVDIFISMDCGRILVLSFPFSDGNQEEQEQE